MRKIIIGSLLIVLLIIVGLFLYFSRFNPVQNPPTSSTPNSDGSNPTTFGASGSSFMDPNGVFTVLYPNDYELDTSDPTHPRIFKRGETQRPQTELYDGALIVFESIDLKNQSLSEWVDEYIKTATDNGMSEIISEKSPITLNTNPGFTFTLRGLGENTNYAIQKDNNSSHAVLITTLVADPENKGYQEEVNATLSSITILK